MIWDQELLLKKIRLKIRHATVDYARKLARDAARRSGQPPPPRRKNSVPPQMRVHASQGGNTAVLTVNPRIFQKSPSVQRLVNNNCLIYFYYMQATSALATTGPVTQQVRN